MFEKYLEKMKSLVGREIFSFLNISKGYLAIADGYMLAMKRLPEDEDCLTIENLIINPERVKKFENRLQEWGGGTVLAEGIFNPKLVRVAMLSHEVERLYFRLVEIKDAEAPLLMLLSEDTFSVVMGMKVIGIVELYEPYKQEEA